MSAFLLAVFNTLPANANCNPGILGLCTNENRVVPTCQQISTENGGHNCLPPNTRLIIIDSRGVFARTADKSEIKMSDSIKKSILEDRSIVGPNGVVPVLYR